MNSALIGTLNINLSQGTASNHDESFTASILNHFNAYTKNVDAPETNLESAQVKAYIQLICDKVCNILSDSDVYQRTLKLQDAEVKQVSIKLSTYQTVVVHRAIDNKDEVTVKFESAN